MLTIEPVHPPSEADREALHGPLRAFNDERAGPAATPARAFGLLLKDAAGATQGGLLARIGRSWMVVETLHVGAAWRGQGLGARLLAAAEAEARAAGCIGAWLDTFSFQAPGFYEKQSYTRFGTIEDFPPGHARHFYLKRLDGAQGAG